MNPSNTLTPKLGSSNNEPENDTSSQGLILAFQQTMDDLDASMKQRQTQLKFCDNELRKLKGLIEGMKELVKLKRDGYLHWQNKECDSNNSSNNDTKKLSTETKSNSIMNKKLKSSHSAKEGHMITKYRLTDHHSKDKNISRMLIHGKPRKLNAD